jgi:hypothetical protein
MIYALQVQMEKCYALLHFLKLPPVNIWHLIPHKPRPWEQFGRRPNDGSQVRNLPLNGAIGSLANLQGLEKDGG